MKTSKTKPNILLSEENAGELIDSEAAAAPDEACENAPLARGKDRRAFLIKLFSYLSIPIFAAIFALAAYFGSGRTVLSLVTPALFVLFFAAVVLRLIPRLVLKKDRADTVPFGERSGRSLHPIAGIVFFSLLAQLAVVLLVFSAHSIKNGVDCTLIEGYAKLFAGSRGIIFGESTRSIASSLGLVSFVLPPNVERMTGELFVYIPVIVLNTLAVAASAVLLYELVICDHSKRCAKFSVFLMHALPTVLVLMQPFGGTSLFFAFSLLSLLLARRSKPVLAGVFALTASAFNIFAVLLAVPIALECVIHSGAQERGRRKPIGAVIGVILALLPVAGAIVLKSLGMSGLFAFESGGGLLDPIGKLMQAWQLASIQRSVIVLSVAGLLLWAVFILFGVGQTRSSHTAFALAFSLSFALLGADLAPFLLFALPIMPSLIGEKCTIRPARLITAACALALLVLLTALLYVNRAV